MKNRASTAAPPRRAPPRAVKSREVASAGASAPRNPSNRRATRSAAAQAHRARAADDDDSEPDAESSDASNDFASSSRPAKRTRPPGRKAARAAKRQRLHADDDDEDDADEDELAHDDGAYLSPSSHDDVVRTASAAVAARVGKGRSSARTTKAQKSPSKSTPKKAMRAVKTAPAASAPKDEIIPPWNALPYMILVQVFAYASAPLNDIDLVRWLLATGRLCRAFAEPALTVLYRSPPILAMSMAHNLSAQLQVPPSDTMFNYRQKVESLFIEVGAIATFTYRGRHLDIEALVANCPRLVDINLYHYKDDAPFRGLDDNLKWTYSPALLKALGSAESESTEDNVSLRLRSWRWNRRMMTREMSFDHLRDMHASPCFSNLKSIAFVNYQRPSLRARNAEDPEVIAQDQAAAEGLANCINALPALTHLAIESSTAANEMLLPLLPKQLSHLELINCWDVTAEHFSEYLLTHGNQLRFLTLNHNQSLSLEFLPLLGEACPNLRALRMDLMYYNHHEFYNDSNPLYPHLLSSSQVPKWPREIQVIELANLRKWDAPAADMFFQSLIDSAPNLPMLRHLAIKAMLDIPWRQRSEIRDKWVARFDAVFQRKSEPPKPVHSLRMAEPQEASTPPKKRIGPNVDLTPSRRSNRIATVSSRPSSRSSSTARGLRKLDGEAFSYREPDSDEGLQDSESEAEDGSALSSDDQAATPAGEHGKDEDMYVHGMCEVVDIRFDNQKPREEQFGMEDFLDSENSNSDVEWASDNDEDGDVEYAW